MENYMVRIHFPPLIVLLLLSALATFSSIRQAHATDPEEYCGEHDALVSLLIGKPHFERRALLLKDELPSQRHKFELFMSTGESGLHTYSLVRTRRGGSEACIVTTGVIKTPDKDRFGHPHLTLVDENDPDIFEYIGCDGRYVILRKSTGLAVGAGVDICASVRTLAHTPRLVVSYGTVTQDNRSEIPWPQKSRNSTKRD